MRSRIELHALLRTICPNVYYQPPESVKITYPAIVYHRDNIDNTFADNDVYLQDLYYSLTVMDKNPDSEIVMAVSRLPKCRYNRHFTSDNLNHDIFTLQY